MSHTNGRALKRLSNRGVALVTALLLLSLFTVLTLSMVIATMSDTLIDGYYRNARASFYGADSGINAIRQALTNDIVNNDVPTGYAPANGGPHLAYQTNAFPSDITSAFSSYHSSLGTSSSASATSWPGTFKMDTTASTLTYYAAPNNDPLCSTTSSVAITKNIDCVYDYRYHLVVDGQSRSGEVNVIQEDGIVPLTVQMKLTAAPPTPFSKWSTLFDKYGICTAPLAPGTFTGTMFSNDSWNFGSFSTKYIFNGSVGAHDAKVGYMYGSQCDQSTKTTDTYKGTTINPNFMGGLSVGQQTVSLPTDTYSQLQAVLDGKGGSCAAGQTGCTNPAPSNTTLAADLVSSSGAAWSTSATSGVYLPYTSGSPGTLKLDSTTGTFGGIYVQGNVDQMTLTASTATIGTTTYTTQVIAIKQGSKTTTVTVALPTTPGSPSTGFTRIQDSSSNDSGWMTGTPSNVNSSPATEGCLVYVTGNISSNPSGTTPTGLSGPSSGAAIPDGSGVTITSGGTVSITGNITYAKEPVSLNVSDTPVSPAPTNVLGIYTTGGNVQFQPPTNVSTMEVDASFAAMNGASGSSYGLQASWKGINTLNIVGGRVQNQALDGSALGARNIYFDQRFSNGFAPPWFPTTMVAAPPVDTATIQPSRPQRLSWVNSSAQ